MRVVTQRAVDAAVVVVNVGEKCGFMAVVETAAVVVAVVVVVVVVIWVVIGVVDVKVVVEQRVWR